MSVPNDVMAQMGFGVADEGAQERMQGVATKLRGDRDLGQFFQLSGSANTRDLGKGMVDTSSRGITEIGKRRAQGLTRAAQKARDEEARRRNAYSEGKDVTDAELAAGKYETAQGRLDEQEGRAEEALAYQRTQEGQEMATSMQALETAEANRAEDERNKREAVALKHVNDLEAQGLKDEAAKLRAEIKAAGDAQSQNLMPASEKAKYRVATHAVELLPGLIEKAESSVDAFGPGRNIAGFMPDGTPNFVMESIKQYEAGKLTDDEQQARAAVLQQSYQIIHELAGSALSSHEKERIEQFTPAGGDTFKTVLNKLKEAQDYATSKHESFKMYNDYVPYAGKEKAEALADETALAEEAVQLEAEIAEAEQLEAEIAAEEAALAQANAGKGRRYGGSGLPRSVSGYQSPRGAPGANAMPITPALPRTRQIMKGRGGG